LMALFMVLFSISSVNISKYQTLQESLKAAFSGSVLPGGRAILQSGSEQTTGHTPATSEVPSIQPLTPNIPKPIDMGDLHAALAAVAAAKAEQAGFIKLKARLDEYAREHGFANQVQSTIDRRGLAIQVLTDRLLFDSGSASLQSAGLPLLNEIAALLNVDRTHPITVEGHTDNVPISSALYPSNWELSTARATTVVRFLIAHGVQGLRLSAAGYADLHPVASNATAAGRALNRRVEIVLNRLNPAPPTITTLAADALPTTG
jgi:chemotaxis protein MotB